MTLMPAAQPNSPNAPASSSLGTKMLDMLVSPGDVFDEVLAAPPPPQQLAPADAARCSDQSVPASRHE
jgi:hypothetical protein